jgi:hypothetical protein
MTAITYPRDFPAWFRGMYQSSFVLKYLQEQDPTGNADTLVRDVGPTLWNADYQTGLLDPVNRCRLEAWLDSLENGGKTFRAYDFRRPFPLAYPNGFTGMTRAGGGSFDGTCTLEDVTDNKLLDLSGLPPLFEFNEFDMLGFTYLSTSHALHRIMAPATANSDGEVTVEVRPHVRPGWAASATVNLAKLTCLMKLVPDSYTPPGGSPRANSRISFKAVQTVKEDA